MTSTASPPIHLLLKLHAREIVRVAYLALLDREPDSEGLGRYSAQLDDSGNLEQVLKDIAHSEEAWNKNQLRSPGRLLEEVYRGLLGRDPDAQAIETYSAFLDSQQSLARLLDDIVRSEELWRRLLPMRQQSPEVLQSDDLPALLSEVVNSGPVWNELVERRFPQSSAARDAYDQDAWVFIHIQKTGGTSLQNMLAEVFGDRILYREKGDSLYRRSPAELAQYTLFAGHFNFHSVSYIPRRHRRLVTFLRDPRQRLLSLYRFLRAHTPDSPDFEGSKVIANRLDEVAFFRSVMALAGSAFWNHMTWCVMGERKWSAYRQLLQSELDASATASHLAQIRADVRQRLREFAFVGLQEDYAHSCQRLFELIGAHVPSLRHDHSVELLSRTSRHFRYVQRAEWTSALADALAPLVQIDCIVYEEGRELYAERWNRIPDGDGFRST